MSQLFGAVDNDIKDFFIKESEELCNFGNNFLKINPDLLSNAQLHGFFSDLPEETSDCFIITEAPGHRKYVISGGTDSCVGNLGSKVGALAFTKTQILLAVLYDHFQVPSSGVEFPCLEYIQRSIGGEKTIPLPVLASLYKENPDRHPLDPCIGYNIIRLESTAVFDLFLLFSFLGKGGGTYFTVFSLESCLALALVRLADLYHPEPMAIDTTGYYETQDICAGKPTVGQNVFEPDPVFDCPSYHLFGKLNLGHPVFALPFLVQVGIVLELLTSRYFLVAQTMSAFFPRLSYKREVKQKLRLAVGNSHEKAFEPKYTFMLEMRIYPADIFPRAAGLVEVSVIYYKAAILTSGDGPHPYLVPQLGGYAPKSLSPRHTGIGDEAVEQILLGIDENFYRTDLTVENIFNSQIRQNHQTLKHRQQSIDGIGLALDTKNAFLGHPYIRKYACYGLHCLGEFFIVENFLISEINGVILCIDMA